MAGSITSSSPPSHHLVWREIAMESGDGASFLLVENGGWTPRGWVLIASLADSKARHPGQFRHAGKSDQGVVLVRRDLHAVTVPGATASSWYLNGLHMPARYWPHAHPIADGACRPRMRTRPASGDCMLSDSSYSDARHMEQDRVAPSGGAPAMSTASSLVGSTEYGTREVVAEVVTASTPVPGASENRRLMAEASQDERARMFPRHSAKRTGAGSTTHLGRRIYARHTRQR
ncbi:hypothetical protein AOQ84DRAFT_381915 [Glonium stellatum]|uniref:Uncharacterized protein n=1 Tax=Glonium stellatum TaxID=574774 RepID=A0A8E2JN39_9PEZI|nr:hypothetical protein AOQ84DRAFT_381915 [Glonium stellatum]